VVVVYVALATASVVVAVALCVCGFLHTDASVLQWTKKQRLRKGELINEWRDAAETGSEGIRNRKLGLVLFVALLFLIAGAWAAYFWGVATGNNK
jgi:hypothetical protein